MDSLTHFHSRNVYFYIHFSNNLKVTALDMFQKILGSHPRQVKILLYLGLLAAILIFCGHLGFLLVRQILTLQIGIPTCSLHAKNRQSVRTTASNLSFRVCIGEFCPILSSVAAILNFLAAILDFYWFVMY